MSTEIRFAVSRAEISRWLDSERVVWPVLAIAVVASGLLLAHLTRGASFWSDDWLWITRRRGDSLNTYLSPYNGHLSLVPLAIYRVLFATAGLGTYVPYRAMTIGFSLIVGVLVFVYARGRTRPSVALVLAALMLFLGSGWQNTMWGFQIPWLIVCGAGVAAFMLLERPGTGRVGDAAVCALLLLTLCSTSLGLAFTLGIAAEIALVRRRWRDAWIVALPLGLYAMWSLYYHASQLDLSALPTVPINIAEAAAASLSSLTGISGAGPFNETANALTYGWPLLALVLAIGVWRARTGHLTPRLLSLTVTFLVFTVSVSVVHAGLAGALASRYVYVYCLLAVLILAELVGDAPLTLWGQLALYLAGVVAIVGSIGTLRSFGIYFRTAGSQTKGALTGLDVDRGTVGPGVRVHVAYYQFIGPSAGSILAAEHALGSPAYTLPELRADGAAQASADAQLLADGDVVLESGRATLRGGAPSPAVSATLNGTVTHSGSCLRFEPPAVLAPGATASLTVIDRPPGLTVSASSAAASLSARRFAGAFTTVGTVNAGRSASVVTRDGMAPDPWYLQLSSPSPLRVCPR